MLKGRGWIILVLFVLGSGLLYRYGRGIWHPVYSKIRGRKTVSQVIDKVSPAVEQRLLGYWEKTKTKLPVDFLFLIVLKQEKKMEVWIQKKQEKKFLREYPVLAASGKMGPKLKEGDYQVPEGIYKILAFNPNSSYHLSLKTGYPNEYDKAQAKKQERTDLGGNIFIHGKAASTGCIAIGDPASEDIFYLVEKVGLEKTKLIIAPCDFRKKNYRNMELPSHPWIKELYQKIEEELKIFSGEETQDS